MSDKGFIEKVRKAIEVLREEENKMKRDKFEIEEKKRQELLRICDKREEIDRKKAKTFFFWFILLLSIFWCFGIIYNAFLTDSFINFKISVCKDLGVGIFVVGTMLLFAFIVI